jgi:chemosensory pili system protein ChpA (sensor histidine kinase/response regulator)
LAGTDSTRYILVVDDEEVVIHTILRRILLDPALALEPLIAKDGYEALALMGSHSVALVLLDLQMRNLDGFEVIRKAKDDPRLKEIPIVVSSGYIDDDGKTRLRAAGIQHFLDKPYTFDQLMQKIRDVLQAG